MSKKSCKKESTFLSNGAADSGQPMHDAKPLSPWYLEYAKMTSFGRFSNAIVGPFTPGLNVVFGPNEAGKTTLTELVKGVLFGWPHARGSANSYRPENAERTGSLYFKNQRTNDISELKRVKNTDDLGAPAPLLGDIDQDTYQTMFALTSDELLHLDRHDEVTARLLTAGSGTSSSPAHALRIVEERIKNTMSRSSHYPQSIPHLKSEQSRLKQEIQDGLDSAQRLRMQEKTLADLRLRRDTLATTQQTLNAEIEDLTGLRSALTSLEETISTTQEDLSATIAAEEQAQQETLASPDGEVQPLVALTQMEEYHLRDSLDDLDERRIKLEHALENARRDAHKSQVDLEVSMENEQANAQYARARSRRKARLVIAVLIPLVMAVLGVGIIATLYTANGRFSYLVAGLAMVVFALVLAAAGIFMGTKPTREEEELEDERAKKAWVVQQDQKTVELCERELSDYQSQIEAFLEEHDLGAAQGSLRRARRLLDQAQEERLGHEAIQQKYRALALQRTTLEDTLRASRDQWAKQCHKRGLSQSATVADVQDVLDQKNRERGQTVQLAHETEQSIGEITTLLSVARHEVTFDEAKLEAEIIETQLSEAYQQLATLLIAQDSLMKAITQWEHKSQPEVYRCASRLFALMTRDTWQQVRMNAQGNIEVVDALKTARSPQLLSLGTRQQLYLSLRIALLLTAENVGRGLPILCDDILVNFDDERRKRAAQALAELARRRQVIFFTCHSDIASLICTVDSSSNFLEL